MIQAQSTRIAAAFAALFAKIHLTTRAAIRYIAIGTSINTANAYCFIAFVTFNFRAIPANITITRVTVIELYTLLAVVPLAPIAILKDRKVVSIIVKAVIAVIVML